MTISSPTTEELFPGNGVQTAFVYTQNTDAEENVNVVIVDPNGDVTELTSITHYDISGVGGSGGITITYPRAVSPIPPFDVVLLGTENIVIWIDPPLTTDFAPALNDAYTPQTLEQRVDDMYRNMQKLRADVDRKFGNPVGGLLALPGLSGILGLTLNISQGPILLDEATASNDPDVTLTAVDWPSTYDQLTIEYIGVRPQSSMRNLCMEVIDNGSPSSVDLRSENLIVEGASVTGETNASTWSTSTAQQITNGTDDAVCGFATFTHFGPGFLSGIGHYSYNRLAEVHGCVVFYRRHSTPLVRPDGFRIFMNNGNLSGTFRLRGIPNT